MWLTPEQAQTLIAHAHAEAPNEACGIIAGRGERAVEITPIPNAAADPQHSYYMDERRLVETLSSLSARHLDLIGFYHCHPQTDPIPSTTDIKQASYPDTPYLIVGLKGTEARLAAWTMRFGQVSEVPLHIGLQAPLPTPALSPAQKIAILLSALIAFILLIVLSLSLLPPAPHIPH
ncbi:MAG: M67 family metallopeptidase [Chloroflexota bacterium]